MDSLANEIKVGTVMSASCDRLVSTWTVTLQVLLRYNCSGIWVNIVDLP